MVRASFEPFTRRFRRRRQAEDHAESRPGRRLLALLARLLERLEPFDHRPHAQRRRLPVEQSLRSPEVPDHRQSPVRAGGEQAAGVHRDEAHVGEVVDRLEAHVVVGAAVQELGRHPFRTRERQIGDLQRRERAGHGGRGRHRLRQADARACGRRPSHHPIADDVTLEPEPHAGGDAGRVEDEPASRGKLFEEEPVVEPAIEGLGEEIGAGETPERAPEVPQQLIRQRAGRDRLDERRDHETVDRLPREAARPQLGVVASEEAVRHRPPRDGRDVAHATQQAGVGHEAEDPQARERRSEAAAGERHRERRQHVGIGRAGRSRLPFGTRLDQVVGGGPDRG